MSLRASGTTWAITGTAGDVLLSLKGTPIHLGWSISGTAGHDYVSLAAEPSHDRRWGAHLHIGNVFTSIDGSKLGAGAWFITCTATPDSASLTSLPTRSGARTFTDRDGKISLAGTPIGQGWDIDGQGPLYAWLTVAAFVVAT